MTRAALVVLRKQVPGLKETTLTRFVSRLRRVARLKGSVNVLLTSSSEMRALNRRFRNLDKPTDVLSFAGGTDDLAGEIAISAEIASRNAGLLGHSALEEIKILIVHGVLHLQGFDHERDNGEMRRAEQRLRQKLGLPSSLIERTSNAEEKQKRARRRRPA